MSTSSQTFKLSGHEDLDELSVAELFSPAEQYVIPIYQRNYAWGATEVEQLIQDIYDAAKLNKARIESKKAASHYFIGSLVVHLRNNGNFETIDGQQRHTTLSILLALMKNIKGTDKKPLSLLSDKNLAINLHFDSRPKSARTLRDLYNHDTSVEAEEPTMLSAYNIAERYLKKEKIPLKLFSEYLFNQVKILRVKVPKDTDLNHYFEIMNNRGEQLEKHEVLKARLMAEYQEDIKSQECFSAIWDACADMHRYVQLGFEKKVRDRVFGKKWDACPTDFSALQKRFSPVEPDSDINNAVSLNDPDGMLLSDIIKNKQYRAGSNSYEESVKNERFHSVIDFPNFLLQVLKVNTKEEVVLDDKRLLETFTDKDNKLDKKPSVFIMQLLRCRILFDKYIIKRDNGDKWSMLTLEPYDKSFNYNNTVGTEHEGDINHQLTMILSMFHVSYPTQVYKHWLTGALKAIESLTPDAQLNVAGDKYLAKLEKLSDAFFEERTGINKSTPLNTLTYKKSVADEDIDTSVYNPALHLGTEVQNFIFNRLDYLLWQKLRSGHSFESDAAMLDIKYIKARFDDFQFSFRTSVEHYFPQTNPWGKAPMDGVDRFGNLCLITPSSNSKLSNYSPEDKKKYYEGKDRSESLKQTFMMSYKDWSPDGSGLTNIKSHEEMMIKILTKR